MIDPKGTDPTKTKMTSSLPKSTRRTAQDDRGGEGVRTPAQLPGKKRRPAGVFPTILVGLCLLLFFLFLGNRPLWDVDEGMHAATSKDMILSGDWITPQYNGENFYDKPVLFNWLAALSFLVFGFTEFAARLPAALLGTGCVIVTFCLGKRMVNPLVGFLGGVILATSVEFIILSRVVVHDIALTFFTTLALTFFYMGFTDSSRRKSVWLLFYAALGFAVLSKGPIGVLLPGLIIFVFLVFKRRLNVIKEMQILWGIPLFLVIAVPWYLMIMLKNQDYAGYFFIHQNLAYFFSGESRHPRPFHYYIPILIGGFFPWSLFLPTALYRTVRRGLGQIGDGKLFLMTWLIAVFLFFSTASSKLSTYILPLFPAAALLVAGLWSDLFGMPVPRGARKGILYPTALLLLAMVAAILYMLINPITALTVGYGISTTLINVVGLVMTAGIGLIFLLILFRRYPMAFAATTGWVVVGILMFLLLIVPYINPYRSTKGLAATLDPLLPKGEKLTFFHREKDSALFYTDRKAAIIRGQPALAEHLASKKRVFCVIEKKHFDRLVGFLPTAYIWAQEGNKLLISNTKPL